MNCQNLVIFLLLSPVLGTIDLNEAELQYLADHLLPEECRKLVAAAHFNSYMIPTGMEQAEQAIPQDLTCLELLHHWNSAVGEGKGETHEVLEHRLRQMDKYDLADWLGKTVFHQLGKDLEESLDEGLQDFVNKTSTTRRHILPSLAPVIEEEDDENWLPIDTIMLTLLGGLVATSFGLCTYLLCTILWTKCKSTNQKTRKLGKSQYFEMVEVVTDSESEDRFDIREHETKM